MRDKLLRRMVLAKPMLKSEVLILPPVFLNLPTVHMVRRSGAVDVQKKHILVSHIRISFATRTTKFVVVIIVISMFVSYEKGSSIMFFSRCNGGPDKKPKKLTCNYNAGQMGEEDGTCESHGVGDRPASCWWAPKYRTLGPEWRGCGCPKDAHISATYKDKACDDAICCCNSGDKYVCFL